MKIRHSIIGVLRRQEQPAVLLRDVVYGQTLGLRWEEQHLLMGPILWRYLVLE